MTKTSFFAPLSLVCLVLFTSCFQGARAPAVTPTRTLAMEGEGGETASKKPFGVVFASPKGETVDPSEVTIVFNRPMRPLDLAGEESAPPAKIAARGGRVVKGTWRWVGTNALIFAAPQEGLPRATHYDVTVDGTTKSLAGEVIAKPYAFSFETPAPKLVRIDPYEGEQHVVKNAHFDLRFNQAVDPAEVARAVTIVTTQNKVEKKIALKASWPKPDNKMLVTATPATPLPYDTAFEVVIDQSLRGMEGPRPLGVTRNVKMHTFGPLLSKGMDCYRDTPHKRCAARDSIWLKMSNRVSTKEWRSHVTIDSGAKIAWDAYGTTSDTQLQETMSLPARLLAGHSYNVTVKAGMKDEYGQTLGKDVVLAFETDDEWPSVEVGLSGAIFEAAAKKKEIPIGSVNVSAYELATAAPTEAELARFLAREVDRKDDPLVVVAMLGHGKSETVRPTAAKNEQAVKRLDLAGVLASTGGRGAMVMAVQKFAPDSAPRAEVRVVDVTDLAISAKMSRFGSLVWVTRLSDGKPVGGAHVGIRAKDGAEVFAASTNAEGVAMIPAEKYNPVGGGSGDAPDPSAIVVARVGDDWTYRQVSDLLSSWRFGASVDVAGDLLPFGMLFTDRGVYRPGETVRVKGIFREPLPRGTATPVGAAVAFSAVDPGGTLLLEKKTTLGPFGDFAIDVPIPAGIALGSIALHADVSAKAAPHAHGGAATSVEVAEYKPAEFKVSVDPEKPAFIRGDKATFTTRGDYLFGAPMSGGKVHYTITREYSSFLPPGAEGMIVDDESFSRDQSSHSERGGEFQAGDGDLSAKGDMPTTIPLPMPHQTGPETVTFESEVEDISRQSIAGRTSALVHPGEFYVALRPPKEMFVPKGAPIVAAVAAIEPSGKRRVGVPVGVDLVRRTWETVVESHGDAGGSYQSKVTDKIVGSCNVATTAALASCNLTPAEPGYYVLHAHGRDARGNALASSTSLYVVGDAGDVGWSMQDAAKLELVADKKAYEIGDTATILVKNPFKESTAIVTLERAGIYRVERHTLMGAMPTLSFPVTADMAPNTFVSIEIVRGRSKPQPAKGADVGQPTYRLGYAEIVIDPESRRLHVTVTPQKTDYRPGDTVDADIVVNDGAGKGVRSNVTFYAVDEGVLMLTGYQTPDPIPALTGLRSLNVFALETRDDLAKVFLTSLGNAGADKGAEGGGGGGMATRQDFRTTAYFEPSLVAENGKAHVRFKLPDSLTTYRLMAVAAAEDDRFGYADSRVTTSRKLMARPEMPRFLRAGDSIDAGIVVTSKGLAATTVEVTAKAEGVELRGNPTKMIALPANGSVEVRFPFVAAKAGHASFTFTAKAGGEADSVQITRTVEVPLSLEAVALYGETKDAAGERLGDLKSMRDDVGGLEVTLASTALVGLQDGVEQLLDYPYGCTEQLTSRMVPFVAAASLGKDGAITLPKNLDAVVNDAIGKVVKNQREDGGFGYWVDSPRSIPFLSAYALWGLHEASEHKYAVPRATLDDATAYLHKAVTQGAELPWALAERAFELDVLAEVGTPDPGETNDLYAERDKLPLFARALLAHAMAVTKMDVKERAVLLQDIDNHLRVTGAGAVVSENLGDEYARLLDSTARTTALVMRALLADDPKSPLAGRLAKGLLAMRKGGSWATTQETAWALVALDEYRKAQESAKPDFDANVFLGDTKIFGAPFHERSYAAKKSTIDAKTLFKAGASGSTLAFQVDGTGSLFYEARLRYAKKAMPTAPLDRGFFVRKVVRSVKPDDLAQALRSVPATSAVSAGGGDLVLVDLFVVTPDPRENVVIDDPLPAGLEAVQSSFATSAKSQDVTGDDGQGDQDDQDVSDDDERAAGRAYERSWYHREFRDDRVLTFVEHMPAGLFHYRYLARATTFGTYVVPPTRAECMYEPETFGRTAAATFEVK